MNVELVRSLGADVVVDYKKQDFEKVLSGYDVVLNSLDGDTLQKSLSALKPGGKLISVSGPPDPDFAREQGLNWFLQQAMRLLSFGIRRKAKRHRVSYSFLFMRANGEQLSEITALIEAGIIRPVVDRVFPFEATNEALAYVGTGRPKVRSSSRCDRREKKHDQHVPSAGNPLDRLVCRGVLAAMPIRMPLFANSLAQLELIPGPPPTMSATSWMEN